MDPFIKKFQGTNPATGTLSFTARNQNFIFCLPLVGAILGAILATPLTSRLGRKWVIVLVYSCSYLGTFLQTFAPALSAFVVGRFFNSICVAVGTTVSLLFLGEIGP